MKKTPLEKLQAAVDNDRMSAALLDAVGELCSPEDIRQLAGLLEDLASDSEEAASAIDEWQNAEGRDDKADARERALEAIENLITAYDAVVMTEDPFTEARADWAKFQAEQEAEG